MRDFPRESTPSSLVAVEKYRERPRQGRGLGFEPRSPQGANGYFPCFLIVTVTLAVVLQVMDSAIACQLRSGSPFLISS